MRKRYFQLEDYCFLNSSPDYRLSSFERLTLLGGIELERALQWAARQFSDFSYSGRLGELDLERLEAAASFYSSGYGTDPASFFVRPPSPSPSREVPIHGLKDGEILDLEFESVYAPHFPGAAATFDHYPENKTVYARWWRHEGIPRATIIALHGWTMGDQRLNSLAFLPGMFYRLGIDVVLVELPFHGRRKPKDIGDLSLFPSADVVRTNEAMGQVISDLRQLRDLVASRAAIQGRNDHEIGVIGMSLGAYAGALWASLDPLSFCIPIVPLASMSDLAWRIVSSEPEYVPLLERGLSRELLERVYNVHAPLAHRLKIPTNRALIIAGHGDLMVPPMQPKMLAEHWGNPEIYWFHGGHAAQFRRSRAFGEICAFLRRLNFIGGDAGR